jgi:1,4-alpha-glucan branching enzyme
MMNQPGPLSAFDRHLHREGTFYRSYEKMGAHLVTRDGVEGTTFAVWAPSAKAVSVIGDFNHWDPHAHPMRFDHDTGTWEIFIPWKLHGAHYRYRILSHHNNFQTEKSDPYGFLYEMRPATASRVWNIEGHPWGDAAWMASRKARHALDAPISIYEVHLGSWMRVPHEGDRWMTYGEIAPRLAEYCGRMGYTHVELLPITEHPLDESWGYQVAGHFAPTSRHGTPGDFMHFVDVLHQAGIGVILDWVPAHFPKDTHALGFFDGTHLYEHADPRKGEHQDWGTFIFNYGRTEVANYLIANALFWLDKYHIDGLRVDAVASMLYLDYSRKNGEWVPNAFGGRENLEAIAFLQRLNSVLYGEYPDILTIAEESTSWPRVSRPTYIGGLGFGYKWDMGWMHDMLHYMAKDPIHRRFHHAKLTFRAMYMASENFMLSLSHDEVVHGKGSLLRKMPGDDWQKRANLRLLLGAMIAQPGKKLLFMGGDFGQWNEWRFARSLDWHLLESPGHAGINLWMRDLNHFYRDTPAMHRRDADPARGFEWIDCNDSDQSIISFIRQDGEGGIVLCAFNFTPVPRPYYRIGAPRGGHWREALNSDAAVYGGSGMGNLGGCEAHPDPFNGRPHSLYVTLPPLGAVFLRSEGPIP